MKDSGKPRRLSALFVKCSEGWPTWQFWPEQKRAAWVDAFEVIWRGSVNLFIDCLCCGCVWTNLKQLTLGDREPNVNNFISFILMLMNHGGNFEGTELKYEWNCYHSKTSSNLAACKRPVWKKCLHYLKKLNVIFLAEACNSSVCET